MCNIKNISHIIIFCLFIFVIASCGGGAGQNTNSPSPQPEPNTSLPDESGRYNGPMPLVELEQYRHCSNNEDCIFINNGCCDCANGGEEAAINAKFSDEFKARFNCEDIICTQRARFPSCGCGTVTCEINSLCVYSRTNCSNEYQVPASPPKADQPLAGSTPDP